MQNICVFFRQQGDKMKVVCLIILGFLPTNFASLPADRSQSFETAWGHFSNFGASVAFILQPAPEGAPVPL